jgi:hypothetical protein
VPCPDHGIRRAPDSFDAIPASVQARTDLYPGAKRLYGLLRSVQNMNAEPSYADLAAALGASVRSIVTWMKQLVETGLITLWRRGLGLTNIATVVGMPIRSAADAIARRKVPHQDTRMEPHTKNGGKKMGIYQPPSDPSAMFSGRWAAYIHR